MTGFVLDCSVTASWCFEQEEEEEGYSVRVLEALGAGQAFVPVLWSLELANVLIVAERRRRLTRADAMRFRSLVRALPITIDDTPTDTLLDALMDLGRDYGLSAYDAAYLELALRLGLPLATLDAGLVAAARRAGVSTVIE